MSQNGPEIVENRQVINLVQAMLGGISHNVRAVSLVCGDAFTEVHFVIEHDRAEDREGIEDIIFEFEALQLSNISVMPVIRVSVEPLANLPIPGRIVYLRKEP